MNAIVIDNFMTSETILTSGTKSYILDLERFNFDGFFSLHLLTTGVGTLQGEYLLSNNGVSFVTPSSAPDSPIFTGFAAGEDMFSFEPMLSRWFQLLLTEEGAGDAVVTAWLAIQ